MKPKTNERRGLIEFECAFFFFFGWWEKCCGCVKNRSSSNSLLFHLLLISFSLWLIPFLWILFSNLILCIIRSQTWVLISWRALKGLYFYMCVLFFGWNKYFFIKYFCSILYLPCFFLNGLLYIWCSMVLKAFRVGDLIIIFFRALSG
jgi:hypothetical protein